LINAKHGFTQIKQIYPDDKKLLLYNIPAIINKTFPIPAKHRSKLPSDIAELSKLLTNNRGERSLSYLARPNLLSAYLYYFLPWNLYRLCLLLPSLDITLCADDTVTDLGCGPLTFTSALWIARPELRKLPLVFNCVDRSSPALEAGKKFFNALCLNCETQSTNSEKSDKSAWKINLIKEDIDIRKTKEAVKRKRKPAALVCAVNLFNEIYENISHNNTGELRRTTEKVAMFAHNETSEDGKILIVEPGVPQSGRFISLLRGEFINLNRSLLSPCTHSSDCPFNKGSANLIRGKNHIDTKKKWCHFAFDTYDAPKELITISKTAKLPKDRLVFSFLYTGASSADKNQTKYKKNDYKQTVRIISDAFPLPENRFGRYGCCERGLILVTGDRSRMDEIGSFSITTAISSDNEQRDAKSGAIILKG